MREYQANPDWGKLQNSYLFKSVKVMKNMQERWRRQGREDNQMQYGIMNRILDQQMALERMPAEFK